MFIASQCFFRDSSTHDVGIDPWPVVASQQLLGGSESVVVYQCTCHMIICGAANALQFQVVRFRSLVAAVQYWIECHPASEQPASCGKAVTAATSAAQCCTEPASFEFLSCEFEG